MKPTTERIVGDFKYRIRSTGYSSERYGPCEVCEEHCTEVFIHVTARQYDDPDSGPSWTYADVHEPVRFGHQACLEKREHDQREEPNS